MRIIAEKEGGPYCKGDQPTVGHILVLQPQGENGKRARCWEHLSM